ncbi:MAG TPA: hypothetical protein VK395_12140 [Gemmataceae bacterium]|nr:hypothetical protein [Gemmataceae bacterium]
MIASDEFPRLNPGNHCITSPPTPEYNCIAWANGDTTHWWQPGVFWPMQTGPDDYGIGVLEQMFLSRGYTDCAMDTGLEPAFEKVALYCLGGFLYTHAARQLPNGKWTSKLGGAEDIEHDQPHELAGGIYGEVVQIMKRPLSSSI